MTNEVFGQPGYQLRAEWGYHGVDALARECAVLIVIDVLSFTTSVDIAVGRGARIMPLPWRDLAAVEAARAGGALVVGDRKWTLRPSSLVDIPAGTVLAVPSPNGAMLSLRATAAGVEVLAGCLRNAAAVASAAVRLAGGRPIGVVPGGERWWVAGFPMRPCVEDALGAGAVVSAVAGLVTGLVTGADSSGADLVGGAVRPGADLVEGVVSSKGGLVGAAVRAAAGPVGAVSPEAELLGRGYRAVAAGGESSVTGGELGVVSAPGPGGVGSGELVGVRAAVGAVLAECASGRELIGQGDGGDVVLAGEVGGSEAVPRLVDGLFVNVAGG